MNSNWKQIEDHIDLRHCKRQFLSTDDRMSNNWLRKGFAKKYCQLKMATNEHLLIFLVTKKNHPSIK
jgi:hypothetical protein